MSSAYSAQAAWSAASARYASRPPWRAISRLIVEGARFSAAAISGHHNFANDSASPIQRPANGPQRGPVPPPTPDLFLSTVQHPAHFSSHSRLPCNREETICCADPLQGGAELVDVDVRLERTARPPADTLQTQGTDSAPIVFDPRTAPGPTARNIGRVASTAASARDRFAGFTIRAARSRASTVPPAAGGFHGRASPVPTTSSVPNCLSPSPPGSWRVAPTGRSLVPWAVRRRP